MPMYSYKCPKCRCKFDKLTLFADADKPVICEGCKKYIAKRQISTGINGGSKAEPWEYEYTHSVKPKYVKDSKGVRRKFTPSTMPKGRRGSG